MNTTTLAPFLILCLLWRRYRGRLSGRGQRERSLSLSEEDLISLSYAVLFHDIGKHDTFSKDERGRVHFYHHEVFSCQAAEEDHGKTPLFKPDKG